MPATARRRPRSRPSLALMTRRARTPVQDAGTPVRNSRAGDSSPNTKQTTARGQSDGQADSWRDLGKKASAAVSSATIFRIEGSLNRSTVSCKRRGSE